MENKITTEKIEKYFKLTTQALEKVRENVISGKEEKAKEIIEMVSNYLSDAVYFRGKNDFVNAFACLNYAHGWLDSGVRLDVFNIKDNNLFTVK